MQGLVRLGGELEGRHLAIGPASQESIDGKAANGLPGLSSSFGLAARGLAESSTVCVQQLQLERWAPSYAMCQLCPECHGALAT